MKIIRTPNLGQDYYVEQELIYNVPPLLAVKLCTVLNDYYGTEASDYYYKVVDDNYELVDRHFEP